LLGRFIDGARNESRRSRADRAIDFDQINLLSRVRRGRPCDQPESQNAFPSLHRNKKLSEKVTRANPKPVIGKTGWRKNDCVKSDEGCIWVW
jgi:hypothetical protein